MVRLFSDTNKDDKTLGQFVQTLLQVSTVVYIFLMVIKIKAKLCKIVDC